MLNYEDIICSQGLPVKNSNDKYYIALFEDYGSITTDDDILIGFGMETYDSCGETFVLKEINKIWYIMLNNKYMAYDYEENCIKFIKDIPNKEQRLEFHQEDKKYKSIMTISTWKKPNEHVVIEWIKCSYAYISVSIDDRYSCMRFQLVKYICNEINNNIQNKSKYTIEEPNILFPKRKEILKKVLM